MHMIWLPKSFCVDSTSWKDLALKAATDDQPRKASAIKANRYDLDLMKSMFSHIPFEDTCDCIEHDRDTNTYTRIIMTSLIIVTKVATRCHA